MHLTVTAIYEHGAVRLAQPLPLHEQQKVKITIEPQGELGGAKSSASADGPAIPKRCDTLRWRMRFGSVSRKIAPRVGALFPWRTPITRWGDGRVHKPRRLGRFLSK